jgi:transposase
VGKPGSARNRLKTDEQGIVLKARFAQMPLKKVGDSTFSKNRHGRFRERDLLRHVFEIVVQRCLAEGLVGAVGFAVDASLIAADANKQRSAPSKDWMPEEIKEKAVRAAREISFHA